MALATEIKELAKAAFDTKLADGSKFADYELTMPVEQAALEYIATYRGDFEYMVKLQQQTKKYSVGQLRGAANCMLAQYRRKQAAALSAAAPTMPAIYKLVEGAVSKNTNDEFGAKLQRPTLTFGEFIARWNPSHQTVDIRSKHKEWSEKWQNNGRVWYGSIAADGATTFGQRCPAGVVAALVVLEGDHTSEGIVERLAELGRMSGECVFCARQLTTDDSLNVGYGPVCAKRYNLPWGVKTQEVA